MIAGWVTFVGVLIGAIIRGQGDGRLQEDGVFVDVYQRPAEVVFSLVFAIAFGLIDYGWVFLTTLFSDSGFVSFFGPIPWAVKWFLVVVFLGTVFFATLTALFRDSEDFVAKCYPD